MFRHASRKVVVVIVAVAVFVCIHSIPAADFDGSVQGIVKNSSGTPVSGAFVKLVSAERHVTFMVISQAQGRYTVTNLPPGKYTVQGIGNGFQSEPVDVTVGRPATADLSLTAEQAPMLKPGLPSARGGGAPGDEVVRTEGGGTLPEGDGKKIVATKCIQCHELRNVLNKRADRAGWAATIRKMRDYAETTTAILDLTDQENKVALDYLAKSFPGGPTAKADSNSRLPRILLQGEATKYMVVEYDVPPPSRGFHEITLDPRGNAWVSELSGNGHIGKLDPKTLTFSEVATPATGASKEVILNGMARGQGDQVWVMDPLNRRLLRYDTKTGEFNTSVVPKLKWGSPMSNSMRIYPDGTLWFTAIQANEVVNFNPVTKKFSEYTVPTAIKTGKRTAPYGMAIDGDGKVWFPINEFDLIGRLDPATGKIDELPIPLKWNGRIDARKMGYDANGDIWVGLHGAGKVMKIDHKTANMTFYTPPSANAGVYGIVGDLKTNAIWFAEDSLDKIGRFDPKTETFVEFPLPNAETDMRRLEVDFQNPNRVWFAGVTSNRIGYIELLDGNGKRK